MRTQSKLMEMLTGYAAAHQDPVNVAVHMIGIPVIMLGVLIPLSWADITIDNFSMNLAQFAVLCLFLFYLSLDVLFALVFLAFGLALAMLAELIGGFGVRVSGILALVLFFGGYLAQFVGHYIEKSPPVILRHPVQANLAAPFFTIVELFHKLGLRQALFDEVNRRIEEQRHKAAGAG